jgi:hypothetical protein
MTGTREHLRERLGRLGPPPAVRYLLWIALCWLTFAPIDGQAVPLVTAESPIGFFTNVATRLLQSQLGVSLNHIQVYPTNQYTPSVHRLLQVTANLYDAITNRADTGYPYLPSVFRPVFTGSNGHAGNEIYISGYLEVIDTNILSQQMVDLSDPNTHATLKPLDMVCGIPLIIGAKKGFPNFNAFAMQTLVQVTRRLQFHRPMDSVYLPVNEIDQMFVVGISNAFGVEAWNSYSTPFPRSLQMVALPDFSVLVTNLDTGKCLDSTSARYLPLATTINVASNTWLGYDWFAPQNSFVMPWTNGSLPYTNHVFLTNSAYLRAGDQFMPLTGFFERTIGATNFYVPHWQVTLKIRLRFALVDSGRIVDYVNLTADNTFNITDALMTGGQCGDPYTPDSSIGSMWCTNRLYGWAGDTIPTAGIINQIEASLGHLNADWNNSLPPSGMDRAAAINLFKGQFISGYANASNTFNAPYQPFRNIYLVTSWQANDPLVHYMLSDLVDPARTPLVLDNFSPISSRPTDSLGRVNAHYEPWGGNPSASDNSSVKVDLRIKDPFMFGSDYWDSPPNQLPNLTWLGRVHRGTPWQTIYLKAPGTDLATWRQWTGNAQLVTNWGGVSGVASDAFFTQPTNDWRLASLVISLLNPYDPRTLASADQPGVSAWRALLDGLTVLTNTDIGQFDPVIVSSNSPQAAIVAAALDASRSSQPNGTFRSIGDLLAIPELSVASPWLDTNGAAQLFSSMNDEACEAIPSQLLPLLRPDSIGAVSQVGGTLQVQFTGADGYAYVVQTSSNLAAWTAVSTNYPANGSFSFVETLPPGSPRRFYRSVLQP